MITLPGSVPNHAGMDCGATSQAPGRRYDISNAARPVYAELQPVPRARLHDLNLKRVGKLLSKQGQLDQRGIDDPRLDEVLISMGIATLDGPVLRPTLAAPVVFGHNPHLFLPDMRIEAHLYGHHFTWAADLVELALLTTDVPHRVFGCSMLMTRNLVFNAFLQRSWNGPYAELPVELIVTEHRFELISPGTLHPKMHVGTSTPVNPTLYALASPIRSPTQCPPRVPQRPACRPRQRLATLPPVQDSIPARAGKPRPATLQHRRAFSASQWVTGRSHWVSSLRPVTMTATMAVV